MSPWRLCATPGCKKPAERGPRCSACHRAAWRKRELGRPSPTARGYDANWRNRIRPAVLERDNYTCIEPGCGAPATEVDHIVPKHKGGTDDPANLQSVCRRHHGTKPGTERHRLRFGPGVGGRGR